MASAVLATVLSPIARAQAPDAGPAIEFEPVVVTATRTERLQLDIPASVDVVERETIRDGHLRVNLSESLGRVPGVVVLDRQNFAQDLQISIRGFGARSTFGVRGVRMYVDGVPATFPDGQGQVSHFPLDAAQRIEVLRGPFSALYGNSSGGVISLTTELGPQPLRVEANGAAGSFGTWRAGASAVGGTDRFAYALDGQHFSTNGYRDHSGATREMLNLRAGFLESPLGEVRLSLNSVAMPDSQDPLGLTRAQYEADPTQAAPAALLFDTRKTTRQTTAGAAIRTSLSPRWLLTTMLYLGKRGISQMQSIPVAVQANPAQPGGAIDLDRSFGGGDVRATVEDALFTTTFGVAYDRVNEDRRGYENFIDVDGDRILGVVGRLRRDESNRVEATGVYAQTEMRAGERWRLHAGLRLSGVRFRSDDHYIVGPNGDDSGSRDFSALSPTVGALFKWTPTFSLYAAYGRGFETPTLNELAYRPDGSAGFNDELDPSTSDNFEIGAKAVIGRSVRATLAVFSIRTYDEIVVRANAGGRSSFGNAGDTERQGIELSAVWEPAPQWSLTVALTALRARFSTEFLTCGPPPCTTPTVPVPEGNRLPGVPDQWGFAELKHRAGWADLSVEWQGRSAVYVNDLNTERAAGFGIVNLVAARTFSLGATSARLFVRVDNIADRNYIGSVIVNESNGRYYEPAPGRAWLAGIDWRF